MTTRTVIRFGGLCLAAGVVAPVAEINNYLLPAFMIVLGVGLMRWPAPAE